MAGCPHVFDIFVGCFFGCKRSNPGFHLQTDLQKIFCKLKLVFIVGKAQGVINLSRMVGDVGSLSAFDDKNVAGYQKLDSFPDGASSDVQHCGQLEFIWKFVFTCELTIYN